LLQFAILSGRVIFQVPPPSRINSLTGWQVIQLIPYPLLVCIFPEIRTAFPENGYFDFSRLDDRFQNVLIKR
jgi:hypothetical protein